MAVNNDGRPDELACYTTEALQAELQRRLTAERNGAITASVFRALTALQRAGRSLTLHGDDGQVYGARIVSVEREALSYSTQILLRLDFATDRP